jgi:hypothetical protein
MARRTKLVTITADGRDKNKRFLLTEMSAEAAEWWAIRALTVIGNAAASAVPKGAMDAGLAGMAAAEAASGLASAVFVAGLRMLPGVDPDALRPLLLEMMACVQYQPPTPGIGPQPLLEGDLCQIEEIATRLRLRAEVLELHLGFSLAGAVSTSDPSTTPVAPAT